jgi:hypothetical protein
VVGSSTVMLGKLQLPITPDCVNRAGGRLFGGGGTCSYATSYLLPPSYEVGSCAPTSYAQTEIELGSHYRYLLPPYYLYLLTPPR